MAIINEEQKQKQILVTGEQIEEIVNKKAEIEKATADIADLKKRLENIGDVSGVSKLQEQVNTIEADLKKVNDLVVAESTEIDLLEGKADETNENLAKMQSVVIKNSADITDHETRVANLEKNTYTKEETDNAITTKVSEIVADAPEDFDTLKEMSDWLTEHSDSAATMNTAIQKNASDIADLKTGISEHTANIGANTEAIETLENTKMNTADIVKLTQAKFDALETKTAPFYFIKEGEATS